MRRYERDTLPLATTHLYSISPLDSIVTWLVGSPPWSGCICVTKRSTDWHQPAVVWPSLFVIICHPPEICRILINLACLLLYCPGRCRSIWVYGLWYVHSYCSRGREYESPDTRKTIPLAIIAKTPINTCTLPCGCEHSVKWVLYSWLCDCDGPARHEMIQTVKYETFRSRWNILKIPVYSSS